MRYSVESVAVDAVEVPDEAFVAGDVAVCDTGAYVVVLTCVEPPDLHDLIGVYFTEEVDAGLYRLEDGVEGWHYWFIGERSKTGDASSSSPRIQT